MTKIFKYSDFEHLVGSAFYTYDTDNRRYQFKLAKAEKYPALPPEQDMEGRTRDAFYLMFVGPKKVKFYQGMIEFQHSEFSEPLVMSLHARGENSEDPERLNFQAVFN